MATRRRTILIVEDDAQFRRLLGLALRLAGFDTREARDGYEAITVLEWAAPHIDGVILDLGMPGLDGLAVRDELSQIPELELCQSSSSPAPMLRWSTSELRACCESQRRRTRSSPPLSDACATPRNSNHDR